jgi:hydroxymethylbilane synthase
MMARMRIGTRGSQLALAQARLVQAWLQGQHQIDVELVIIKTTGDRFVDQPLSTLGGKGVFVKEIEEALLAQRVDCAVHSMKDVPAALEPGLVLAAIPQRESAQDVLVTKAGDKIADLARGARVGTSSLRRMALLRAQRGDLDVVPLRGNVDSRLRKLDAGELDAIVLAAAGLHRLGVQRDGVLPLPIDEFVPAIGQGALAIETRNDSTVSMFAAYNHPPTAIAVAAERAFLLRVGGSCRTPLAAHATVQGSTLTLDALVASVDGREIIRAQRSADVALAAQLGSELGAEILARGGQRILDELAGE